MDCCCICTEPVDAARLSSASCGHRFHYSCIRQWADINDSCPLCRQIGVDWSIEAASFDPSAYTLLTPSVPNRPITKRFIHPISKKQILVTSDDPIESIIREKGFVRYIVRNK
jgi:hypothetical protein